MAELSQEVQQHLNVVIQALAVEFRGIVGPETVDWFENEAVAG